VTLVASIVVTRPRGAPAASGAPVGSGGLMPAATSTARPTPLATTVPTAIASSAPAAPDPTPRATTPPRSTGDPRLAYAAFLLRVNDDRTTVQSLNGALSTAAQAQDPTAVRKAAVAILDFVDGERDWLREHPPADCYAEAHASANFMLEAYGFAADRFIAWAETGGGLAGLTALGDAVDAAQAAGDALEAFGTALKATTCQA